MSAGPIDLTVNFLSPVEVRIMVCAFLSSSAHNSLAQRPSPPVSAIIVSNGQRCLNRRRFSLG